MNCGHIRISGLVVEYIVAIDVTRVRFPDGALFRLTPYRELFLFSVLAPISPVYCRAIEYCTLCRYLTVSGKDGIVRAGS